MDSLNHKILQDYRGTSDGVLPTLVLVTRATGTVHVYPGDSLDQRSVVLEWLEQALEGKLEPDKMLHNRQWKPLNPGYDFLKLIQQDEMAKNNPQHADDDAERRKRIEIANEYGMGFEADGSPSPRPDEPVDPQRVFKLVEESKEPLDDEDIREELLAMRGHHGQRHAPRTGHKHTEL